MKCRTVQEKTSAYTFITTNQLLFSFYSVLADEQFRTIEVNKSYSTFIKFCGNLGVYKMFLQSTGYKMATKIDK